MIELTCIYILHTTQINFMANAPPSKHKNSINANVFTHIHRYVGLIYAFAG